MSAEDLKRAVGEAAASRVRSGMVLGLGTGSTTAFMIEAVGRRIAAGELTGVRGVPTSFQASVLARRHGVPLADLGDVDHLDLAIDGADEVDPGLNLIKGGGAAHTREKVVDALAREFIVVVDKSKMVEALGAFPVPVEVLPFACAPVERALRALGAEPALRMGLRKDGPVVSDNGNWVLDAKFPPIADPGALESAINGIPGVVENGLFVRLAHRVLVGETSATGPQVREIPRPDLR